MNKIDLLDKRFIELVRKPNKTKDEIEEIKKVGIELDKELHLETKGFLNELKVLGLNISSVWDLVNTSQSYPNAISILINHLSRPYHRRNKEGMVRALAVKEAKGVACRAIIDEYLITPKENVHHPSNFHYRWAFGNTMSVIITEEYVDEVIDIVLDESNGESRHMFVRALGKFKLPKVKKALEQLSNDKNELIHKEAEKALKKIS